MGSTYVFRFSFACALAFLAACHSSVTLGDVNQTKPIDSMTTAEVKSVASDFIDQYKSTICTVSAVYSSLSGGNCESEKATCLSTETQSATVTALTQGIAQCAETPEDITACADPLFGALGDVTCSGGFASLMNASNSISTDNICACQKLVTKCSSILSALGAASAVQGLTTLLNTVSCGAN